MTAPDRLGADPILSADELTAFLEATAGSAAVAFSTGWCTPCLLMTPLLPKLAQDLSFAAARIDGDAAPEVARRHGVENFPTLVVFREGVEIGRMEGFAGYDALRRTLADLVGRDCAEANASNIGYRDAVARARAAFDATVEIPQAALDARIAAVAPELDALQSTLDAEVAAGRLAAEEARDRLRARQAELFAPFRHELDAAEDAEEEALAFYARRVSEAMLPPAVPVGVQMPEVVFCRIGDPSCRH